MFAQTDDHNIRTLRCWNYQNYNMFWDDQEQGAHHHKQLGSHRKRL